MRRIAVPVALVLACGSCGRQREAAQPDGGGRVVRTAVIGGMVMTGLWPELAKRFEAASGCKVEVVASGPRPVLAEAFRAGKADLLTMHSGDITTDLVADGYGVNMRPWTRNDLVIVGPAADPAGVAGLADGAEALRRIARSQAPFVDFRGIGTREMCHKLWQRAGIEPKGPWVIADESAGHLDALTFAQKRGAYIIVGRMPVLFGKLKAEGMKILVEGDPEMRRPYVVMEANPARFPQANAAGARALSDFLLSEDTQKFLAEFGAGEHGGIPLFHPVAGAPPRQGQQALCDAPAAGK